MNTYIVKILKTEEESNVFKTKPYYCSKHYPTIGWGFRCKDAKGNFLPAKAPLPNITMTPEEGERKLNGLIGELEAKFTAHPLTRNWFPKLDSVRQATLMSMAYQLGFDGLMAFTDTLGAIAKGDWVGGGKGTRNSKAYKQTTNRWERNARMIETGVFDPYYK